MAQSTNDPVNPSEGDSLLGMSDEDLMNLDPSSFDTPDPEEADDEDEPETAVTTDGDGETADPEAEEAAASAEADDADGDAEDTDEADDPDSDDPDSEEEEKEEDDPDSDKTDDKEDGDEEEEEPASEAEVDYKAEYEKILAPFKANGKELRVKNADEAVTLMQMGANYNKKMAALKPNLKLMKLLENNELLDEQKLSYLVDLNKKDPEAIKKLVKDSGLDPLEINTDEESKYQPNTYTVHDREIELDTVLDEIQDTPSYSKMIDVVSNKWDSASKQVIAENPQLLKVVNDHMASGIYDQISKEIESERLFGRLVGMSDLEAYRHVGDAIQERGGFNHLSKNQGGAEAAAEPKTVAPKPSAKKPDEAKRKDKKRAASTTKAAGPAKDKDFNPLNMSDDEFGKLVHEGLM